MRVYVNDQPVDLFPGMRVKHALIATDAMQKISRGLKPCDAWGHELGLDGALVEGMKIYVQGDDSGRANE